MKDNNNSTLDNLLLTSDYNEVRVYLKRKNYLNNSKIANSFWRSQLPISWFQELIKEPFFEDLLFSYFKQTVKPNNFFLKEFFNSKSKSKLIKIIKLSEAFNLDTHWESFSVFTKDIELNVFHKELVYVKSFRAYWEEESKAHNVFIKSLALEDILFQMTMCYEDFKQYSKKSIGNKDKRVSYEAVLINLLNTFLSIKKEDLKNNQIEVQSTYDPNYFKTISVEDYQVLKNDFRNTVEFYFAKYDDEYQIKKYLSSFATFEFIDGWDSVLKTNVNHSLYRKTLERGNYDETYLTNYVVKKKEQLEEIKGFTSLWDKQFKLDVLSSIEYFKFLNLPINIYVKKNESNLDIEKVLYLLKTFSLFFMPQDETVISGFSTQRQVPEEFKVLFYSDYITSYEEYSFIDNCAAYFKWTKLEVKEILDFITLDLSAKSKLKIDIKTHPLVKVGNQYFWLSSFFKDRRWEITLHKKIASEGLINANKVSDQSENYLANIFKEANFRAISSKRYNDNSISGEIDLLAYKNGVLFIGELKSTYVIEDMMRNFKYEIKNFNKASHQLDLAKDYVLNNFEEIKNLKELNIDCNVEDLKIETIIISNIYQADHIQINKKHLKVSLFELLIILKNDLKSMLVNKYVKAFYDTDFEFPIDDFFNTSNKNNLNIKGNNKINENSNLWEDEKECSPNDLISAIKENKVWKHQDANKNYPIEEIELAKYNKLHKYLS